MYGKHNNMISKSSEKFGSVVGSQENLGFFKYSYDITINHSIECRIISELIREKKVKSCYRGTIVKKRTLKH